MPTMFLNHQSVKGLKPAAERYDVFDSKLTGFSVRVATTGRKTFQITYRVGARVRWRRHKLGVFGKMSVATAREEARLKLEDARKGIDPGEQRAAERKAQSFEELAHAYIDEYVIGDELTRRAAAVREKDPSLSFVDSIRRAIADGGKPARRSWKETYRILFGSPQKKKTGKIPHEPLVKKWGNRAFAEIGPADVDRVLATVRKRGPFMANRVYALISGVWAFAIRKRWVKENVCASVTKPIADEREFERDRVLANDEIRTFWAEAEKEHPTVAALLKTHLLTAQRSNEIKRMAWSEISFEDAVWTIPASRSKNKYAMRVPLSADVVKILKDLRTAQIAWAAQYDVAPTSWVFQSTRSRAPKPITAVQKATERVRERCGFDVRTHDLRRTAASYIASMGVPRFVVRQVLNHTDAEVTSIYDRYGYDREKRDALDRWSRKLASIIANEKNDGADVIAFATRARA